MPVNATKASVTSTSYPAITLTPRLGPFYAWAAIAGQKLQPAVAVVGQLWPRRGA